MTTEKEPMTIKQLAEGLHGIIPDGWRYCEFNNESIESVLTRLVTQHTAELQAEVERLGKKNALYYQQISDAYDATCHGKEKGLAVLNEVLRDRRDLDYLNKWGELEEEACKYFTEAERLKGFCTDLQWMAKRYAEGRQTYAPSTVNEITRQLMDMGVELNYGGEGTPWARDGGGQQFSDLSAEEWALGEPLGEWSKIAYAEEFQRLRTEWAKLTSHFGIEATTAQQLIQQLEGWR